MDDSPPSAVYCSKTWRAGFDVNVARGIDALQAMVKQPPQVVIPGSEMLLDGRVSLGLRDSVRSQRPRDHADLSRVREASDYVR
jgi:hypothetical protein